MEIVSVILRLKNQELKVSIEEAKELFGQLATIFGSVLKEKEYVPYPVYPSYPWWAHRWWDWNGPYQPVFVYNDGNTGKMEWQNQGNTMNISIRSISDGSVLNSCSVAAADWQGQSSIQGSSLGTSAGGSPSSAADGMKWSN